MALHTLLTLACAQNNVAIPLLLIISYHSLARLTAIHLVFISNYAREDELSKAKPIAQQYSYVEIIGAYLFGLAPMLALQYWIPTIWLILLPLAALLIYSRYYFKKWIDGYTGDCLGAVEQLAELCCLLGFYLIYKFS